MLPVLRLFHFLGLPQSSQQPLLKTSSSPPLCLSLTQTTIVCFLHRIHHFFLNIIQKARGMDYTVRTVEIMGRNPMSSSSCKEDRNVDSVCTCFQGFPMKRDRSPFDRTVIQYIRLPWTYNTSSTSLHCYGKVLFLFNRQFKSPT